ncbi:MAG: hypothetical protein ACI9NQ_000674 [Paracoccaceae bacterium]|jgi:hypothetical protein
MKLPELQNLSEGLEEEAHLVVWEGAGRLEIVALRGEIFEDAFPLPIHVQAAAAEAEMILDTTTAARLALEQLPDDFWEDLREVTYGERLRVSMLGRAGQKYLFLYRAVREGADHDLAPIQEMALTELELFKVSRWMREESLFDHQSGDAMMTILTRLR